MRWDDRTQPPSQRFDERLRLGVLQLAYCIFLSQSLQPRSWGSLGGKERGKVREFGALVKTVWNVTLSRCFDSSKL